MNGKELFIFKSLLDVAQCIVFICVTAVLSQLLQQYTEDAAQCTAIYKILSYCLVCCAKRKRSVEGKMGQGWIIKEWK